MATPYHRLARETPAYAWWRLPLAALVIAATYLGLSLLLVAGAAVWFATTSTSRSFDRWLDAVGDLDLRHVDYFVLDLLAIVLLIPAVLLGVLATGPRPIGYLTSVAGRMRWSWLGVTALIASAVSLVTIGCSVVVTELTDPSEVSAPAHLDSRIVIALVAVLLVVPFQAAAEEYLFRGYLLQLVGSWSRFAVVPVVVTTPLFVAGHGYGLWGLLDVALFGLTAAILTIRTGGLEAAIAAHAANNVVLFALDALGVLSATDDSGAGPVDLVPSVVASIAVLALVERAARRRGIQRTREPIPEPPAPMWPPPPWAMPQHLPQHAPQHVVAPPPPALHPDTPDYPGDVPPGWR
ncbi:CPBP family intramembrane glutamic endopeptidase [Aeromicrobium endophyticum]|uniref:CPBP family intramembrane metalloprotease n=1 Tax=Aeromicrobium endophyticum TaxID=2292704 RepID=A0A371PAU8_9ACTN|nr:CPBP family intramembrane glutamic endopeptidase [Aeromicrobium endophyticum]REK73052.1 CPBP family intramembrane metalloprotease [Aeromicrobium endophyticum]